MRLTADTNVLVRAVVADDAKQTKLAQDALQKAETIALSASALCEFVWVLSRGYGLSHAEISEAIRTLLATAKVEAHRPTIQAGLAMLDAGGDFADGVIAFEGASLGGDTFASFDKAAVALLQQHGKSARLLA